MKAVVDKGGCISCGVCVDTCPEVFQFDGDGVAEAIVDAVPAELEGAVLFRLRVLRLITGMLLLVV